MTIIDSILAAARNQEGKPYVYGQDGPNTFDCSGLISYVFGLAGINLPHNAAQQQRSPKVTKVAASAARPGDLVFYGSPAHHVALYIGNGRQISAPHAGAVVHEGSVSSGATYGRVSGTGAASNPAVSALLNVGMGTGAAVQTVSFSVDDFFRQARGVSLQVGAVLAGLALAGAGLVLATRQRRKAVTQALDDAGDAVAGAVI